VLGEWILTAWVRISSESFVAGLKKCLISSALGGTEDDWLSVARFWRWNGMRVTVKKKKNIIMRRKLRIRTLSKDLSLQRML
jgi:hypothetical protein